MRPRRHLASALVALTLAASACGFLEPEMTPASVGPRPADAPSVQPAAPDEGRPVDQPQPGERIERFGFVHDVDASGFPATVTFDEAAMLTGDAAEAAFLADHGELPEGGLPNDYYIDNPQPDLVTLPMVGNVAVTISVDARTEALLGAEAWAGHVRPDADGEAVLYEPYHLVVVDGEVVEVRQQYLP